MRNVGIGASESTGSAGDGYTRCRSPRLVVGGSFGLDRAHGVGAGKRRQRRALVQSDGQGVRARPDLRRDVPAASYGFRPGRGCHDALREVSKLIEDGHVFVVDADLKSYFDSIPHERLMQRIEERVSDGRVLELLRGWLKADI